ncbi:MAG: Nif3-like dinuclear metal center hexameric protein [Candidatus Hodarchaeota archaeon]
MNTDEIIKEALNLVNMKELPMDSAIYVPGEKIQSILYGIDIGSAELLYAKENNYDCVIAHHPIGCVDAWRVFLWHIPQLKSKGISSNEADEIVQRKANILKFGFHARNYDGVPSLARELNLPFINIHSPSDELGRRMIQGAIEGLHKQQEDIELKDIGPYLEKKFIEFEKAQTRVEIAKGKANDLLGNFIFSHGALTNGGFELAEAYYRHGVDTVIYIHISPPDLSRIKALDTGQLIITGHLASDSVGINPLLDRLSDHGCEITAIGGLIR